MIEKWQMTKREKRAVGVGSCVSASAKFVYPRCRCGRKITLDDDAPLASVNREPALLRSPYLSRNIQLFTSCYKTHICIIQYL